jgi:hypothetical protein
MGAPVRAQDAGWRTFVEPRFGTQVQFPAGLFTRAEGAPPQGTGQRFRTSDGRAQLSIYALQNDRGFTPASYLRTNLQVPRESLTYQRIAPGFFAISARHEGMIYYSRCNFASAAIHCVYLTYPAPEKQAWDAVVTRISRSLRPV